MLPGPLPTTDESRIAPRGLFDRTTNTDTMDAEISPEEVAQLLDADEDVRVVDIRPASQFERGHIPGSENVPFHALADEIERLDGAERVVTVCPHGQASVQAARLVASYEGVPDDARVESMAGGLEEWVGELATENEGSEDARNEGSDGTRDEGNEANENRANETDAEEPDAPF
jgi:rhodanese-related sulfurtransferase